MGNEWLTPLMNTVITPFLVIMVGLLTFMVNEWRKDFTEMKKKAGQYETLLLENQSLKRDKEELEEDAESVKRSHKAEIDRLNQLHAEDIDRRIKETVDAAVKPLNDRINQLDNDNASLSRRLRRYETGELDPSKVPTNQ